MSHHKATHNEGIMNWNIPEDMRASSNSEDDPQAPPSWMDNKREEKSLASIPGNRQNEASPENEGMLLSSNGDDKETQLSVATLASSDSLEECGKFAGSSRPRRTSSRKDGGTHRHGHKVNTTRRRTIFGDTPPPIPNWVTFQPPSKKVAFKAQNEGNQVSLRDLAMILSKQLDFAIERGWYGPVLQPECGTFDEAEIGIKPNSM